MSKPFRKVVTDKPRQIAFEVFTEVIRNGAYSNLLLPQRLLTSGLDQRDKAFITELVYGSIRQLGRNDYIAAKFSSKPWSEVDSSIVDCIRIGAYQLFDMRVPTHAAVDATVPTLEDLAEPVDEEVVPVVAVAPAEHVVRVDGAHGRVRLGRGVAVRGRGVVHHRELRRLVRRTVGAGGEPERLVGPPRAPGDDRRGLGDERVGASRRPRRSPRAARRGWRAPARRAGRSLRPHEEKELREDEVGDEDRDRDHDDRPRRRVADALGATRRAQTEIAPDEGDDRAEERRLADAAQEVVDARRPERRPQEELGVDAKLRRGDPHRAAEAEHEREHREHGHDDDRRREPRHDELLDRIGAEREDERIRERAAPVEVRDQRGDAFVEVHALVALERLENFRVMVPAAGINRHPRHAGLDEPSREQAALAEVVHALQQHFIFVSDKCRVERPCPDFAEFVEDQVVLD